MTKKALIVDDSRLACKVMARMLAPLGFQSSEVYSAEEALNHLRTSQPDVIFLDHSMSGMNGFEVIKIIKNNQLTANIPVLMYTAMEGDYYVGQATALGAVDVLPKGLDKKRLHNALKKIGLVTAKAITPDNTVFVKTTAADDLTAKSVVSHAELSGAESIDKPPEPSQWMNFWLEKLEPYLEKQKNQQQKEFEYNIRKQTQALIRDMHITLEQFEHALVLRMESHADFVSATEEVARGARRKWLATLGTLILIFQLSIFWQLWQANEMDSSLFLAQQTNAQKSSQLQQSWNQSIKALTTQVNQIGQIARNNDVINNQSQNQSQQYSQPTPSDISLNDERGDLVANLILVDELQNIYAGVSNTGYLFEVNPAGEIGSNLDNRYYLTNDCSSDAYVIAESNRLYKDFDKSLWYIDRLAQPISLAVHSTKTLENDCIVISGELMELYHLQKNFADETGIEETSPMKIIFSR